MYKLALAVAASIGLLSASVYAQAYITNGSLGDNTIAVIDTTTNTITDRIALGVVGLVGVTVTPDGSKVYVTNLPPDDVGNISAIDTQTKQVIASVPVGRDPWGLAVTPDGRKVYVAVGNANAVAVFDTRTNSVATNIPVEKGPQGVAVSPDGNKAFVSNAVSGTVSVISAQTDTVVATIDVGNFPMGVAISPGGAKAYITNFGFPPSVASYLSVIDTADNRVISTIAPIGEGAGGGVSDSPFGVAVSPDGSKVYVTELRVLPTAPGFAGDRFGYQQHNQYRD